MDEYESPEILGDLEDADDADFEAWDPEAEDLEEAKRLTAEQKASRAQAAAQAKAAKAAAVAQGKAERAAARDRAKAEAQALRDKHKAERTTLAQANGVLRKAASAAAKARNASVRDQFKRGGDGKFSSSDPTDMELVGDLVPLIEAARDGEGLIRIVAPGWGTSGYYGSEALIDAAKNRVFAEGTRMFWDHPTKSEERERPERSLRDLAGKLTEDARWDENGPVGPGLYAHMKALPSFAETIRALGPDLGVSIRATGAVKQGEREGRKGTVVEAITRAASVDFVTAAGAGGRVVQLFEAARPKAAEEDDSMELKEAEARIAQLEAEAKATADNLAKLTEAKTASDAELARHREAAILREARDVVAEGLKDSKLADLTKARILEACAANPPTRDGALDKPALQAKLAETVKSETEYIAALTGNRGVQGFGGGSNAGGTTLAEAESTAAEAFKRLGLSDDEAKAAARGR